LTYLQQCNTLDRNPIFYSFSRLTAIVANTDARIYAREEQILAIRNNRVRVGRISLDHIQKLENEDSEQQLTRVVA